ncbi:ABC1 kinase family protein [Blastococcus tunisiensis]|uniref:Predicted unusual protein kinase regulating ubiquinone biosynthesis, AarF/ABC1/UbiB family n=1 Tax=Blastococcus tunisiensis TaxID=1798228 RepID=A0A1I2B9I9_9ACTN|nr:AarF/ABC1/UbiB kinase family protein [Blastococcus sp. DSM 46838]SFE52801.1 Predicted unusual protein kinase regulating ubiquinone biosynthesis, AarF/ABC1/UbiB family [Blastococcus sp. DSM 46838]
MDTDSPEGARPARGRLARAARLAALPAAHAGRTAVGHGKRIGGRPAEAVTAQVQQRTAAQLFATLGQLKGGAMKVGQALSAMEAALPDNLVEPYREALVRLQEAAPPMPAAMVHTQLDRAFPGGWTRHLRDFDDRHVAAASIGQVHRATWSDGTPVAVKVQYPGAADALLTDLRMLQPLAPIISAAMPGLDGRELIAELRTRLVEELDYAREAEAQTAFADAYRDDPDITVPDVLAAEGVVLVTRWLDGTPLSQVIASGTRPDRDRAGLLLVRLLLSAPVRARRLHGDPHPGNFRLLPDGRLGVLDFGATEPLPTGWPARLGPLLAAGRDGDAGALHRIAASAGLLHPDKVDPPALLALLGPYLEPLRTPEHRFTRSWLQEQTRRASDPLSSTARTERRLTIPPRHLLLQRVASGLAGVLCSLGATVAVDAEARRWLPGYDDPAGRRRD